MIKSNLKLDEAIAIGQSNKIREYWLEKLSGDIEKSSFYYDYKKVSGHQNKKNREFPSVEFEITGIAYSKIIEIANNSAVKIHMILVTVLVFLLSKCNFSGNKDIMLGTPIYKQDIEGDFINTVLVLRSQLSDSITFKEFLFQVEKTIKDAVENQNYPIKAILYDLNIAFNENDDDFPLFDIAILLENIQDREYIRNIPINMIFSFQRTKKSLLGILEYNSLLYESKTIKRIVENFQHLLDQLLHNLNAKLSGIEIISNKEKERLLFDFNKPGVNFPEDRTMHQLFEEQVKKTPHLIALVSKDRHMTYKVLNSKANQLAGALKRKGIVADTIVGIMIERSIEMIITIIGVWKAGGAYMPIDLGLPINRINLMLDDCQVHLLITHKNIFEKHPFTALQQSYQLLDVKPKFTARRPQIPDLNKLPFPDRSLVNYERYNKSIGQASVKNCISIQTSRGCPYKCAYCHKIWPKTHIFRSAENIFEEVKLHYKMGVRRFAFIDDIFNFNRKNSMRFFQLIIENGLDVHLFFPNGIRGDILTEDYIDLMIEAGTVNIAMALETASPRLQKLIGKHLNLENFRINIEYIIKKYPHVIIDLFTMHGFPTETEEEAMMTLNFIKSLKWVDFPWVWILKVYPDTEMAQLAIENGISREAIERSLNLAFHELPETLPWDKSFTKRYKTEFFNDYFLSKERLLYKLPYQMKLLTEIEMIQQYNSILPVDIRTFPQLLEFLKVSKKELGLECLDESIMYAPNLNEKLKEHFSPKEERVDKDALKVLILDLSLIFSDKRDAFYDIHEPPLGPMYLITYLKQQYGSRVHALLAKSLLNFDSYAELKALLDDFKPDVIGIRTLTYYKDFFHQTIAVIRQWGINVPIISGGPYATSSYKTILQDRNIDLVVLGEGEITFAEIIQKIMENGGKLPNDDVLEEIKGIAFIPGKAGLERKLAREIFILDIPGWEEEDGEKNGDHINQSTDLAYVIFTSGSTGKPKGVGVEHKGIVNMLTARKEEYKMDGNSTSLQLFPYAFDGFITSLFTPIVSGAKVLILDEEEILNISKIKKIITTGNITHFISIPEFFQLIIENLDEKEAAPLKVITLAGSKLSPRVLAIATEKNKHIQIVNEYGVTEGSVLSTLYKSQAKDDTIKIGAPICNTTIYIMDNWGRMQPIGVPGEMCIAGVGLARGYLNNAELTSKKFTSLSAFDEKRLFKTGDLARWLTDGNIELLGRIDHQLKVRGFRVELGEIENQLLEHEGIKEAVVVAQEDERNNKYLTAYIVEKPRTNNQPELWPSVAEFFVYDDLLYYAMTHDKLRNESYKQAIDRFVKDKVVVDIGTGKDAILARLCVEAGAKKVYATELLEESYKKAKETLKKFGLEEEILLIHGDATKMNLPETVDVCVSELVGPIGGCEGAAVILNTCRRLLKEDGVMIPAKSITKIAAVSLPDEIRKNPGFTKTTAEYVEKIFESVGYSFDLRICVKNLQESNVISTSDDFECLDFSGIVPKESTHKINLLIQTNSRLDGFLIWLNLYTGAGEVIDILKNQHCWLPVFVPVFYPGVDVLKGDKIEAECIRTLSENKINPDYKIKGVLIKKDKKNIEFNYDLPHFERSFRKSPLYQELFNEEGWINIINNTSQRLTDRNLREYLSKKLPDYMIPYYFVPLKNIPLTLNGKIDRRALPDAKISANSEYVKPTNELEQIIADIWKEVLNLNKVGINDNYFELGGNSYNLIQTNSCLQKALGREIEIMKMFAYPTIHSLYKYLTEGETGKECVNIEKERYELKKVADSLDEALQIFEEE